MMTTKKTFLLTYINVSATMGRKELTIEVKADTMAQAKIAGRNRLPYILVDAWAFRLSKYVEKAKL